MMKVIFYYSKKQIPEVFFEKGILKGLLHTTIFSKYREL